MTDPLAVLATSAMALAAGLVLVVAVYEWVRRGASMIMKQQMGKREPAE